MSPATSLTLIRLCQRNDPESGEQFVEVYLPSIRGIIWRLVANGSVPTQPIDDLTQEVLLKLWENLHRFPSEEGYRTGRFRAWLREVTRNTCISVFRKQGRMPMAVTGGEDHQERLQQQPGGADPAEKLIEIELQLEESLLFEIQKSVFAAYLESLLEWQKIVLTHPREDSLSLKELAAELKLNVKEVYKFREKAQAEIRRRFDEEVRRQFPTRLRDDHE